MDVRSNVLLDVLSDGLKDQFISVVIFLYLRNPAFGWLTGWGNIRAAPIFSNEKDSNIGNIRATMGTLWKIFCLLLY